jgi:sugar lactone lactonase YvrE
VSFDVLLPRADILGESPLWCPRRHRLYWVDIRRPALQSCDASGGDFVALPMPELIGSFAFRRHDGFVVALKSGLYEVEPSAAAPILIAAPEGRKSHRFNESKCDPRGRFWAGTMNDIVREPTGSMFRLCADRTVTVWREGIAVPNSLAWSPDGRTMYFADTEARVIEAWDYDLDDGWPSRRRVFADLRADGPGRPDGATVDADGCLWSAQVASGEVVRYAPDGRVLRRWKLPVSKVTSLAFGGTDLRTLYATSGRYRLTDAELAAQPLAGALFAMRAPVSGLPADIYAG